MKHIRVGIIGYGFMGHEHVKMLTKLDGINVIAVADKDPSQLKNIQESILTYNSAEELLENPDVDVVIISANNNQHLDLVVKSAKAGKDIICEKPVAMTLAELDEMTKVANENNVKFTVHHQRRLDQDYRITKEVYDQKLLGEVYTIKNQLYGFNGNMHDWHVYISEGGGMLYDWGVHLIDQILWMVDSKVTSVYATMKNVINFEVDDFFNIQLRFENGVHAEIELGTYYLKNQPNWFERHWFMGGNKGSMYIDGFNPKGEIVRTTELLHNVSGKRTMTSAGPTRSFGNPREGLIVTEELPKVNTCHEDYFRNYVKAYNGEEEFLVNIPEVRRVLALMDAVRESARTGKSIDFE